MGENEEVVVILGKSASVPDYAEGYFVGGSVWKARIDKKGRFKEIIQRAGDGSWPLLRLSFHEGRFRMTTRDKWGELELREFKDEDHIWMDVIGLMAFTGPGLRGECSMEAISISGPGIPDHNADVEPEEKLPTVWGGVKKNAV